MFQKDINNDSRINERMETCCPSPMKIFSTDFIYKKMPCRSALNFGENLSQFSGSNFFLEYPVPQYPNSEILPTGMNSLIEPKPLSSFSSPVGDLDRTIAHYRRTSDFLWNSNSITLSPTHSGSSDTLFFDRRDSPVNSDILKTNGSFDKVLGGRRSISLIFPVGSRLDRISTSDFLGYTQVPSDTEHSDIIMGIDHLSNSNSFEKFFLSADNYKKLL
ncbi:hypothetical protein cand_002400 [Cryptosporidium andersoni]|uniref:Uncharacterized protein n=1 Tax=Cryptosporidium andersoni TaxID=117008 RepID=A0A1J4MSM5_9CRYT|nr:hypothetical protein cand_002400 [Cryptosporidium andersoni]